MSVELIAALISALIALFGYLVTTDKTKKELNLKKDELDTLRNQVHQGLDKMRQELFVEVLKTRLNAYPRIYQKLQEFNRIWRYSGTPLDHIWIKQFLEAILECNATYGVLFSRNVYNSFHELRCVLYDIEERLKNGGTASEDDLEMIDSIISGPLDETGTKRGLGLGFHMKNDLGSYRDIAISTWHS